MQLLENGRLGSLGVNLAAGVLTPAFQQISSHHRRRSWLPTARPQPGAHSFAAAQLHDPIRFETVSYRPLPPNRRSGSARSTWRSWR